MVLVYSFVRSKEVTFVEDTLFLGDVSDAPRTSDTRASRGVSADFLERL